MTRRRRMLERWLAILVIAISVGVLWTLRQAQRERMTRVAPFSKGASPTDILRHCGTPTADESSADEIPRPLLVTRRLTYEDASVRFVYVPDMGAAIDPLSDTTWRLVRVMDPVTHRPIPPIDAATRMAPRCP